jgi:hypothetical protein
MSRFASAAAAHAATVNWAGQNERLKMQGRKGASDDEFNCSNGLLPENERSGVICISHQLPHGKIDPKPDVASSVSAINVSAIKIAAEVGADPSDASGRRESLETGRDWRRSARRRSRSARCPQMG